MILFSCFWSKIFLTGAEDLLDSLIIFEGDVFLMFIFLDSPILPLSIIPADLRMRCISACQLHLTLLSKVDTAIVACGLVLKEIRVEGISTWLWCKDYVLFAEGIWLFVLEMQGISVTVLF